MKLFRSMMPEEILPNLSRIEIPLPHNPLRVLNSYLVKGPERSLVIDTGLNRKECMAAMVSALGTLKVDLSLMITNWLRQRNKKLDFVFQEYNLLSRARYPALRAARLKPIGVCTTAHQGIGLPGAS